VKIYDGKIDEDEDEKYECCICRLDIILNDTYMKCNFKHYVHDTCYKSYYLTKKEIICECILCFNRFI
jgi:hypothetical protein